MIDARVSSVWERALPSKGSMCAPLRKPFSPTEYDRCLLFLAIVVAILRRKTYSYLEVAFPFGDLGNLDGFMKSLLAVFVVLSWPL